MIRFRHSGNLGDVIFSLPTIAAMGGGELYLRCNVAANYSPRIAHPLGKIRLSKAYAELLIPLLEIQTYISKVAIWENQKVDIDLDDFRAVPLLNYGTGHIPRWYSYATGVYPDLSKPWLTAPPDLYYANEIIVNRTNRYLNPLIDYSFLRKERILFVGLQEEWSAMKEPLGWCEHITCKNYLHLASILIGCKGLVANQSSVFAVAEGLKIDRVLEAYPFAPNVIPMGGNGMDCYDQINFEKCVKRLLQFGH